MSTLQKSTSSKLPRLSERDLNLLDILEIHGFNRNVAWNSIFPGKEASISSKSHYFDGPFRKNRKESLEYLSQRTAEKYGELGISRERIILDIVATIQDSKQLKQNAVVVQAYNLLSKLLGYQIDRHELDVHGFTPVTINYVVPEQLSIDPPNTVMIEISNPET